MRRILGTAAASLALLFGLGQPSKASLMLEVSDGTTTQTAVGASGIATFLGAIGNFAANVTTGISKPLIGSVFQPILDLNSIDVTSANAGGTLTISLTDTDFIGAGGIIQALSTIGGTLASGSLKVDTFLDCGNKAFGETTHLTSQTLTGNPFSGSANTFVNGCQGNYSVTQVAVLTLPGGAIFSGDSMLAVPEPSTAAIFGIGLLGLGLALRRKTKAA
jgi:hypothetical protein